VTVWRSGRPIERLYQSP